MAIEKQRLQLKPALGFLLYFSIIFGVVPFSGVVYYKHKILKISVFGNIWALVNVIHNAVEHHLSSTKFILGDKQETGTLTNIIGLVIMYLEPVMYALLIIVSFVTYSRTRRIMCWTLNFKLHIVLRGLLGLNDVTAGSVLLYR